jgi:hypothetical protein
MRHAADDRHGLGVRAVIVVQWRAGLRIQRRSRWPSTTSIAGADRCWSATARAGRRREVGMDEWGWEQLRPWLTTRADLLVGAAVLHH